MFRLVVDDDILFRRNYFIIERHVNFVFKILKLDIVE